ncbi:hypothetical protein ES708_31212 [subsurface metagenome]
MPGSSMSSLRFVLTKPPNHVPTGRSSVCKCPSVNLPFVTGSEKCRAIAGMIVQKRAVITAAKTI